ncbi:MAG: ribonuclease G [Bacteroidetes bacterium CG12_big_fil_rev_8_21_14_0_65_60_17]|nr:MAG: ribonuclease G [Bacteroidetes bacterium CG12_big_fil_rev_8_21_14_0_65_60_17]
MSKEIIVNHGKQTRLAILENGELVELFIENPEHERTIGNIFLGRVRRIMPSIQAAFVDIGQKQDAFLHFSDLIENVTDWLQFVQADKPVIGQFQANYVTRPTRKMRRRPRGQEEGAKGLGGGSHRHVAGRDKADRRKSAQKRQRARGKEREELSRSDGAGEDGPGDPTTFLKRDQPVLVKISKEPIANKGSRVTTDISLAGRFLVLVPMANYVAVSKKIQSFKERRRLRALANSLLPEGFGVIVRTVASGKNAKSLDTDLNLLLDKWRRIEEKLAQNPKPPVELHEDVNMTSSIMRDLFTDDYDRILIDDHRTFKNVKGYVQAIAPQMADAVQEYTGKTPVFDSVGISATVNEAFESRVNMPSGGYLFIEQTEAMHVVDVNSGRAGKGMSQEDSSLKINLEAARVIARQVRLRDLGGIIVIDFIDMRHERNRRKVFDELRREFRKDRAVTKVLPMSDFGLMQVTRQRLRPSITKTFSADGSDADPDVTLSVATRQESPDRTPQPRPGLNITLKAPPSASPEEILGQLDIWIQNWLESGGKGALKLCVHPFLAAWLNKRIPNQTTRWFLRHLVRVKVVADDDINPLAFRFIDQRTKEDLTDRFQSTPGKKAPERKAQHKKAPERNVQVKKAPEEKTPGKKAPERNAPNVSQRGDDSSRHRGGRGSRGEGSRGEGSRGEGSRGEGGSRSDENTGSRGGRSSRSGGGSRSSGNSRSGGSSRSDGRSRSSEPSSEAKPVTEPESKPSKPVEPVADNPTPTGGKTSRSSSSRRRGRSGTSRRGSNRRRPDSDQPGG